MSRVLRVSVLLVAALVSVVRPARAQSAQFTWPANGATGVDLSQMVAWTSVPNVQAYYLYVGTTAGAQDLVNSGEMLRTNWPVCDVPTGQVLYARINTKINNVWSNSAISFTATGSPPCKARITQPAGLTPQPTSALPAVDLTSGLTWTSVPNATAYYLYVGNAVGGTDLANSGEIAQTSYLAIDLPIDGRTLYVRLWTKTVLWRYLDYKLTASAAPQHATFIAPTSGATNVNLTEALQWTTGSGGQAYYLKVGSSVGASNYVNSGETQQTLYWPCPTIPAGQLVYASIQTKFGSVWKTNDITFTPSIAAPACGASLAFPGNGATNVDLTNGFSWLGVPHTTAYQLTLGTSLGASDVLNTGSLPGTQTSLAAYDLPVGRLLYARLWTRHENVWYTSDSSFTLGTVPVARATFINPTDRAIQVDPAPAFRWTAVPNAQAYYLYVGTTVGANNLVNTGEIQPTSYAASTLPANVTLFARLWTKLGGVWRYVDITFSVRPPGVAATGCSAQPGTIIYGQNWSRGVAPNAMPNQPDYYSYRLWYENSAWVGFNPPDSVYPEIVESRIVTVFPGAGPAGENALDFNPAGTQYGDSYDTTRLTLGGFGPIADPAGGPSWWDAADGCISQSYKWTTAAWDQGHSGPLLNAAEAVDNDWKTGFSFLASANTSSGAFTLSYTVYGMQYDNKPWIRWEQQPAYPFTRAATENQWHTFMIRWKAGTTDDAVTHVESDGWLQVYWNGTLIYNVRNIPLLFYNATNADAGVKPNRLRKVSFAVFGPTTNLEVVDTRMTPAICTFTVSPASDAIGGTAHTGSVPLTTTPEACAWEASTTASWIHPTAAGQGPGLRFTVDANPTASPRSGMITIGNAFNTATYTLTQRAGTSNDPATDQVLYYHTDAIGSVRLITNAARQTVGTRLDYLPFGEPWSGQDARAFTGAERDQETGLDYLGVRSFSSGTGRFTRPDDWFAGADLGNPQSFNLYGYARNNPLRYVDPTGHDPNCPSGADFCTGVTETDPDHWIERWLWEHLFPLTWDPPERGGSTQAVRDPACNNAQAVTFVHAHQSDAAIVAQGLAVPTENILGLSAIESMWGRNRFALEGNNFFSLHGGANAPFATGSMRARGGASMSTFPSYLASARSFAAQYGRYVQGLVKPEQFSQGLIRGHYNSGIPPLGNPRFIIDTSATIVKTKTRMGC
jgi:RHS repeat-associated protein